MLMQATIAARSSLGLGTTILALLIEHRSKYLNNTRHSLASRIFRYRTQFLS